ncbi:TonB-dependent receptor [Altericroceibacterium xinjiangense]|uniref:TonB-dependent receptor n=1 Tax=Altericroceibacterium xinjiangense TaxID=762261 RepID=UPI000F7EDC22|nr:TonB-dependent receptor [Altericroceibacterium xinjiangense]
MLRLTVLLAGTAAILLPSVAAAQETAPAPAPVQTESDDDFHGSIIVTAPGLEQLNLLAGTSVLSGLELQRNMAGQIGEILAKLPGVSATSFSPGASRPVLRGFQGDRVRVLVDGIGSIDASNTSADHAVPIDPLTADRIEVLRGPAVLLYGSSAIGGAVNVIDKRIPLAVPDEPVHIDALAGVDTAYDLREGGASADVSLTNRIAFHVDGSYRTTNDVEIPGYVLSDAARADLLAEAEEHAAEEPEEAAEFREMANQRGVLPNSATETWSVGSGIAWFGDNANLGVSAGWYDTQYGVPMRPGTEHHHEEEEHAEGEEEHAEEEHGHGEEDVSIGLEQFRANLRGAVNLGGFFSEARTRWGYSDYTHTEFEGDEVGTVFQVEGVEGRVELVQTRRGGWSGAIGGQFLHRDFSAIGAEAFVPPNTTDQYGLFTLQQLDAGPWELQLGGRLERTETGVTTTGLSRDFNTVSGAAGISSDIASGLRAGINVSRVERAPTAEELFAEGPHIATQQFEVGNPDLTKESAWGLEGYVRGRAGPATVSVSVYRNWFDAFVYLQATGAEEDELPVYRQLQQDANHFGIEGEVTVPVWRKGDWTLLADARGDYIRATLADGSPVPRIPPLNLLGALELQSPRWEARAEVQWFDEQDRIAEYETPTSGFTWVNASVAWKPWRGTNNLTVMLQADNIFDVEGRRHASFTKDFVPLAGRNVKLSVRTSF